MQRRYLKITDLCRLVKKMFYILPNPHLLDEKEDLVEENV